MCAIPPFVAWAIGRAAVVSVYRCRPELECDGALVMHPLRAVWGVRCSLGYFCIGSLNSSCGCIELTCLCSPGLSNLLLFSMCFATAIVMSESPSSGSTESVLHFFWLIVRVSSSCAHPEYLEVVLYSFLFISAGAVDQSDAFLV